MSQVNESCKLTPSDIELVTQKALELQNYLERENLRPRRLVTSLDSINNYQILHVTRPDCIVHILMHPLSCQQRCGGDETNFALQINEGVVASSVDRW